MGRDIHRSTMVPEQEAYVYAFSQPFVKPLHRRMLLAHRRAPRATADAKDLARRAGVPRHSFINLHYGVFAHKVADLLDLRIATYNSPPEPLWTTALAEGWHRDHDGIWVWHMYPEACAAIDELGWIAA